MLHVQHFGSVAVKKEGLIINWLLRRACLLPVQYGSHEFDPIMGGYGLVQVIIGLDPF